MASRTFFATSFRKSRLSKRSERAAPMIVLAIDTAGVDCSAAIYDGASGKVLATVTDMIGKGHAERLMAVIDEALLDAGRSLDDIDRIAVVIGPGPFHGLRVGVAAADRQRGG